MLTEMYNMRNKIQCSDMTHDDRATMCAELMYYQELLESLKSDNYSYGINVYRDNLKEQQFKKKNRYFTCVALYPQKLQTN